VSVNSGQPEQYGASLTVSAPWMDEPFVHQLSLRWLAHCVRLRRVCTRLYVCSLACLCVLAAAYGVNAVGL
jgi:hypothetical protein